MRETLKLYWMAFNTALQGKFEYRVDFVLGVLTSCMMQMASLAFLLVIFHQTPGLNGWAPDQVVLLFGLTAAALGASELFFNHIWMVPYYIVMGELDRLLTYPVNSLYFLLITRPELHAFGNLATGFTLASIALAHLHAPWTAWLLLPFATLFGCLIYTSALVISTSFSFVFISATSMHLMIPHTLLQATRYPLSIYPNLLQYLLLLVIPYGAFNYLPAGFVLGKGIESWLFWATPLACLAFITTARYMWQWGLKHYESTGS
jgi:ABC-2 type transport system permease protein